MPVPKLKNIYPVNAFKDLIQSSSRMDLFSHTNPDGDAAGATMGLAQLLRVNFNMADVACWYDSNLSPDLKFLSEYSEMAYLPVSMRGTHESDVAMFLDVAHLDRAGPCTKKLFESAKFKSTVKIDHHHGSEPFANINMESTAVSSTCEYLYNFARASGWEIDNVAATCLYTGILTDTGNFSYNISPNTFYVAGDLVGAGADVSMVKDRLAEKSIGTINATGRALAFSRVYDLGSDKMMISWVPSYDYNIIGKGHDVIDMMRNCRDVEYFALVKQAGTKDITVSLRSRTKPILHIAESLGARGGQENASGCKFVGLDKSVVVKTLLERFRTMGL